jgi:Spy/CpxP family protein refolding chaperone
MKLTGSKSMFAMILLSAAIGCGGSSANSSSSHSGSDQVAQAQSTDQTADTGAAEDDSTADLASHHRHHHHGGFAMFIAMSLDGLNATSDQLDQITKIQADMHAKMQPAHDAEKAILLALADGVAAGNVDRSKLAPLVDQLGTSAGAIHDAVADSLNQLHAVLTPPQRQALVDKVEAHLAVWHHTNVDDETGNKDKGDGHVDAIVKELALSSQQADQLQAAYLTAVGSAPKFDRAEADAHFKAFATAFVADQFDAKSLTTGSSVNSHMATWGISRTISLYTAAAPILTPDQRTKAADELRRHANYKRSSDN